MPSKIIPLLHNVYSQQRVVEAARIAYGLGYDTFVVTKASASAAQAGVPEASKLAIKLGRRFLYLADLPDALELLNPSLTLLVVPPKYAETELSTSLVRPSLEKGPVLVVFGGADPGLSKRELEMGTPVFLPNVEDDVGSLGTMAIGLYLLKPMVRQSSPG